MWKKNLSTKTVFKRSGYNLIFWVPFKSFSAKDHPKVRHSLTLCQATENRQTVFSHFPRSISKNLPHLYFRSKRARELADILLASHSLTASSFHLPLSPIRSNISHTSKSICLLQQEQASRRESFKTYEYNSLINKPSFPLVSKFEMR